VVYLKLNGLGSGFNTRTPGPIITVMTANPPSRNLLFAGIGAACLICLGVSLCASLSHPVVSIKLLRQPMKGGDARAWFQFENRRNQPVEIWVRCLEEQHGSEWQGSRECPFTEVLGNPNARLTWTVPSRATNVFFCQAPTTELAYRLNVECRSSDGSLSHFGDRLRNSVANLVWLSCRQVGPRARVVPLSKSRLMSRIRGGTWLVTEPFWARSPQRLAGAPALFMFPATVVSVPDERNVSFK
jgi:hypothetical protein